MPTLFDRRHSCVFMYVNIYKYRSTANAVDMVLSEIQSAITDETNQFRLIDNFYLKSGLLLLTGKKYADQK